MTETVQVAEYSVLRVAGQNVPFLGLGWQQGVMRKSFVITFHRGHFEEEMRETDDEDSRAGMTQPAALALMRMLFAPNTKLSAAAGGGRVKLSGARKNLCSM